MKSWSDTLVLPRPLRDARLSSLPLTEGPEPCGADRERESFERGRREGERATKTKEEVFHGMGAG